MPVSFRFVDNKDPSRQVSLAEIDDICCAFSGATVQAAKNCRAYEWAIDLGTSAAWDAVKASKPALEAVLSQNSWLKSCRVVAGEPERDFAAFYRKLLLEDFTFEAWR